MNPNLYAFIDKQRPLIQAAIFVSLICFAITFETNRLAAAVAASFLLVSMTTAYLFTWEQTKRNHAKALQSLKDQLNSSSPQWDGVVRSAKDLMPRKRLLQARIEKDKAEILSIQLQQWGEPDR